ncbi:hypothetical protein Tco_0562235 [Tanacetum coccineum]
MQDHHLIFYVPEIKQLAIKRVDEYGFVIRPDLVRLTSGSVGPFYSINIVPVISSFLAFIVIQFTQLESLKNLASNITVMMFDDDMEGFPLSLWNTKGSKNSDMLWRITKIMRRTLVSILLDLYVLVFSIGGGSRLPPIQSLTKLRSEKSIVVSVLRDNEKGFFSRETRMAEGGMDCITGSMMCSSMSQSTLCF